MGQSFFHFKHFSILQQSSGLKVTTDACLLGALAQHPHPLNCLDIGTGTGILALMLAQRFPQAHITAVELEKAVAEQAFYNISQSDFEERIQILEGDALLMSYKHTFDLIVCNPPYFVNHLQRQKSEKNTAIHNASMPMEGFIQKAIKTLNPGGYLWVIYPAYEMELFQSKAHAEGLFLHQEIKVKNKPGKEFRHICCFSQQENVKTMAHELLLYDDNGYKTTAFSQLMHDFYLENTEIYKRNS